MIENKQLQSSDLDRLLVLACLKGDERAWESMVRSHTRRIFNFCLRFTGRRDEAEDLTQEIFIRVYRNLGSFRVDSGNLQSWILSVARNLIVDHYRKERRFHSWLGSEEMEAIQVEDRKILNPSRAFDQAEASRLLSLALTALSPELRETVELRDVEGMSYQQVAETTGVSEGTVKSRLFRGRHFLSKTFSSPASIARRLRKSASMSGLADPLPCGLP
jgi:RNA polymerase sigma-70 factor (ECF subfamily)